MKLCLACEGVTDAAAPRCGHCGAWLLPTDAVHYPTRRGERDAGNPLLGSVVDGKYRLQAVLGRGGLGTVFQAQHIGTLVQVALKLLHPRFAERPEYRRALLPEARRAATVTHAGCARLLDVGEAEEGVAYLAMELVEGDTLDVLMRSGRMHPRHAVLILQQIAAALEAIHAAGLVHCDLAPRNVMVAARGDELRVKVLDFGIARTAKFAGAANAGQGEITGFVNPVFSAPELLAGEEVDVRADVYSFGSLAWLLLTGAPPVDDSDPRRAAMLVAAGELRPWPRVAGVPRRLSRLVQRCVEHDRVRRPAGAAVLRHELAVTAGVHRPAIARSAAAALLIGVMATLASSSGREPAFLRLRVGSALTIADLASPAATSVQYLQSRALATLGMHFGGFRADALRVDVTRDGVPLLRVQLRPEVDRASGMLTLSTAQPRWRELLEGLQQGSRDGPVDVSFIVPGQAPFGTSRVQVDDSPPRLECRLEPPGDVVVGTSRLVFRAVDESGVASMGGEFLLESGRRVPLAVSEVEGEIALGAAVAAALDDVRALGAGRIVLSARDRAGNLAESSPIVFRAADVLAPHVVEVTGPAGETVAPIVGPAARLRVRLSAAETDCVLRLAAIDQAEIWRTPVPAGVVAAVFDVPIDGPRGRFAPGSYWFVVEDRAGNADKRQFAVDLRDRSVHLEFPGARPGAKWIGRELVLTEGGAMADVAVDEAHRLVGADVELSSAAGAGQTSVPTTIEAIDAVRSRLGLPRLPAGMHVLRLSVAERGEGGSPPSRHVVPVVVLPPAIELRLPAARTRFLAGVLDVGLLARRGSGLGEGPAWRIDPALLPYVRGTLWLGAETPVKVALPERATPLDPLLPDIALVPGHSVVAVELKDVLDRPVRVFVGDGPARRMMHDERQLDVVADFWWHDALPTIVGEEVPVELGHAATVRLRSPLPFGNDERDGILLGIAQSEVPATRVVRAAEGSLLEFEVPFEQWSVAARLAGKGREDYASGLTCAFAATLATPAGRQAIELRVRTTRSTLEPLLLSQIADVPAGLAGTRFLPVLAPIGPFAEPVPAFAPPRASFRPQVATAVRDMTDFLLQEREFSCGEARAVLPFLDRARLDHAARCVHHDDPLGPDRLRADALLPASAVTAPADSPLTEVDFYQAWTFCRLLGVATANDPDLYRLPLGCELELAAYSNAVRPACSGVVASGGTVSAAKFADAARELASGRCATTSADRDAGDVVRAGQGASFTGLDFGVREWVADLPHVPGAELLLREWIGDHATHSTRVRTFGDGSDQPPPDLAAPLRTFGAVRGLALGELDGVVDGRGSRVDLATILAIPETTPGVLRTEQLRRDGRDLLVDRRDPRLRTVGFRVVCAPAALARLRGLR